MAKTERRGRLGTKEDALRYFLGGPSEVLGVLDGVELRVPTGTPLSFIVVRGSGAEQIDARSVASDQPVVLYPGSEGSGVGGTPELGRDDGSIAPDPIVSSLGDSEGAFRVLSIEDVTSEMREPEPSPFLQGVFGEAAPKKFESMRALLSQPLAIVLFSWPDEIEKPPQAKLDYRQLWELRSRTKPKDGGVEQPMPPFGRLLWGLAGQLREYFSSPEAEARGTALLEKEWPNEEALGYRIHQIFQSDFGRTVRAESEPAGEDPASSSGRGHTARGWGGSNHFARACMQVGISSAEEIAAIAGLEPSLDMFSSGARLFEKGGRKGALDYWGKALERVGRS